jgi:TRAP-type C4-dicarboxylate transport system permease large subunit
MDLFIAAYRFKTGIVELTRACAPFFLIVGLAVLIITWFPWLSLALL